jgi:IMP cyclohydrolase
VKINPNGKQLVVYRVTTLLFPGKQPIAKQNVCLITFDKFLTNVKLFHVYIKVHNTTRVIGHKPVISNMFNRFEIFEILKY